MRRLVRPPSGIAVDCGTRAAGASGAKQRFELVAQVRPVAAADDALLVDERRVPRMDDRGAEDALLTGVFEVHWAVVDEYVDVQLHAARDLVVGAVQVVERHADAVEPSARRVSRALRAVARDVDPVALLVPALDGLDRFRIGLGLLDVLVAVALCDHVLHLVGIELSDAPAVLLLVRHADSEVLLSEAVEQIPVVVQGGVDVECDSGHVRLGTVGADGDTSRIQGASGHTVAGFSSGRRLWSDRGAGLADYRLAPPSAASGDRRALRELRRLRALGLGRSRARRVRARARRLLAELPR